MHDHPDETVTYRLGKKSNLWIAFTPSGHGPGRAWQLQVTARNRGAAKTLAVLLETTPVRPLASVTVRGEAYPLTVGWHEMKRGGVLCCGGERRTGTDGSRVQWEMRWTPSPDLPGGFEVGMRVRATPRRDGHVELFLNAPLHRPELWAVPSAAVRGHGAAVAWSAYNRHSLGFVMLDADAAGWDGEQNGFRATLRGFPLGGGKLIRFSLRFGASESPLEERGALVRQYVALAGARLHTLEAAPALDARAAVAHLTRPENYDVKGAERVYLKPPDAEPGTYYAGHPFYPADALKSLADWGQFHPGDGLKRLVRFGARGLAADFQVMGRQGQAEPNKGAFWDRMTAVDSTDFAGGATHGLASNARLARAFFLLNDALDEPLLRQSALNVCQWLILKQNESGYYDGERVHATRGLADDGKFLPNPCSLDGIEAIRPFVLAFRATANEVFVKAAWKIANHLLDERLRAFDDVSPATAASAILALIALDAEAPNARLRAALGEWGAWLRALPLAPDSPALDADGLHGGLYECAQAGLRLHALLGDPAYLRYAFHALAAVPHSARARSWQAVATRTTALLSLACLLPDARPDFDAVRLGLGWRVFAPDPATAQFLRITGADGGPVDYLPLVCRLNDQLLLIALAPPSTPALTVFKNGRRPLVRDLLTGALDSDAPLHPLAGENWARVGLFTIDP
ncbi:MAG: hypothetical protein JO250_12865 [Armatimonadetes bacterium]|nr:hypothetical protein [Armatimonadota bacterium]